MPGMSAVAKVSSAGILRGEAEGSKRAPGSTDPQRIKTRRLEHRAVRGLSREGFERPAF